MTAHGRPSCSTSGTARSARSAWQAMLDFYLPKQGRAFQEWLDGLKGGVGVRVDRAEAVHLRGGDVVPDACLCPARLSPDLLGPPVTASARGPVGGDGLLGGGEGHLVVADGLVQSRSQPCPSVGDTCPALSTGFRASLLPPSSSDTRWSSSDAVPSETIRSRRTWSRLTLSGGRTPAGRIFVVYPDTQMVEPMSVLRDGVVDGAGRARGGSGRYVVDVVPFMSPVHAGGRSAHRRARAECGPTGSGAPWAAVPAAKS